MRKPHASMESIAALVSVAKYGDWARAAEQLGVTKSALHKRLRLLSALLDAQLIRMSLDRITLTDAGELFYLEACQTLEHAMLAEEKTRAHLLLRANHLLIGHSTYLPPRLLAIIRRLSEGVGELVRLQHWSGLSSDVVERVRSGTLHAGFVFLPVETEGLLVRQVFQEPLVACIPSGWPLASHTEIRPQDLVGQPFISVGQEAIPAFHAEIEDYLSGFGITLRVLADAFSPAEALAYVEQKIGVCLLAASAAVPMRGVTVRPLMTRALTRRSGLILREDNRDPQIAEFMDMVLKRTAKMARNPG
jgi:DNA-binding transcriptional LysR family regulator